MTPKEIKFCQEYLLDFNAAGAARRAGYSKKTAVAIGAENLRKPHISSWIEEQRKAQAKKAELTLERILAEYAKVAMFDIRKIYNDRNALIDIKDLDDDSAAAISGIETLEEYDEDKTLYGFTKKVKVFDKIKALDSISKVLGYNAPEKLQVENSGTLNVVPLGDYRKLSSNETEIDE